MERLYDDEIDHMIFVLRNSKCIEGTAAMEGSKLSRRGRELSECEVIARKLEAMKKANDAYEKYLDRNILE